MDPTEEVILLFEQTEVYDWLAEEQRARSREARADWLVDERNRRADLENRRSNQVNPVNGHGWSCECRQCPAGLTSGQAGSPAGLTPARRPNVLVDQVVPVCVLMAMVTVCGLVLLPVVVPLLAISAVVIVATAVVIMAGVVAVIYATNAVRAAGGTVKGEVVRTRRGWR